MNNEVGARRKPLDPAEVNRRLLAIEFELYKVARNIEERSQKPHHLALHRISHIYVKAPK